MILNNEIDKLYEQGRECYTKYFFDWINKNFNYGSYKMPCWNKVNKNDDLLDPLNLLDDFVKKETNTKELAYRNEEKTHFFDKLQIKVYKEIENELCTYDDYFVYFLHGLIAQNRELSFQIVSLQKDLSNKTVDSDLLYKLLLVIMTNFDDSAIIQETAEDIESFISTQENAIEFLINKLNSLDTNINSNNMHNYQMLNYNTLKIQKLLSLAYIFILLHNSRKIFCSGVNYENVLYVHKDGTYSCEDNLGYEKTSCTNYNYLFNRDWLEYNHGMSEKMKRAFKRSQGFDLDILYAINVFIKNNPKNVLHFKDKEEVEEKFNSFFNQNIFNSLFSVFTYKNSTKKNLLMDLIPESQKFHNKVLVEINGHYIIYKQIAWQALERYRSDVHINPHRYLETSFVYKISKNFERTLSEKLVNEFPGSYAVTGIPLNKFGGKRELDIIFVFGHNIHIIECKKIKLPESLTEILGSTSRLRGKWTQQRDEEKKEYFLYKQELLTKYSNDLGIDINNLNMYNESFDIVTTETTLAHRDKDSRIFIVQDFIKNIRKESIN